jgi:starch-binding outer membrane protein, SusD/RagB family
MRTMVAILVLVTVFMGCEANQIEKSPDNSNADEMMLSLVGIKYQFAVGRDAALYNAITINGMITKEITTKTDGDIDLSQLRVGYSAIQPYNSFITRLWKTLLTINKSSIDVMVNSRKVPDAALGNSIYILGGIYRALALGTAAAFWEEVPVEYGADAEFSTREEALKLAVGILDSVGVKLQVTTVPQSFYNRTGAEIDLRNTILMLSARYHNMLGNYTKAREFALRADPGSRSVYFFNSLNPNPVYFFGTGSTVGYKAGEGFGLPVSLLPDAADKRRAFFLQKPGVTINGGLIGFFAADDIKIPIYQPGERLLIIAESYLWNDPAKAKNYLDSVLLKKPSEDIYNVGADLPAYSGPIDATSLKMEIFRNRCIELYMSGHRMADARRMQIDPDFDKRSRNNLPYPLVERDGNIKTPPNPVF